MNVTRNRIRRAARAAATLMVGMLAVTTMQIISPNSASAHDYGHECNGRTNSGFSCARSTGISNTDDGHRYRRITLYYNGDVRGSIRIYFRIGTHVPDWVTVCDYDRGDNSMPRIKIKWTDGFENIYPSSASRECIRWDTPNKAVNQYRAATRHPDGGINHGTIWYSAAG